MAGECYSTPGAVARAGATVCHNASPNLRLKNGIAPVNPMLAGGVNMAMGTESLGIKARV